MSGPSNVIVLDPDLRAGRQVQLGFAREGIQAAVPAVPADLAALRLDGPAPSLVVVGSRDARGPALVRRARELLTAAGADIPILVTGRDLDRQALVTAGADEVISGALYLRDVVTLCRMLRNVPAEQRDHLVGSLAETTGVYTLVRALCALGRSAVLTLIRGLRRGEIRFFRGEVTSAQVGLIHGQAALHQLLLWTDARFDFSHEDVVRRQQIPLSADELFADAERFLEGVRESAGPLSPATVLEPDLARVHELGKEIPTEVHGVLRMFDGHRVLADILEDSPYRVFETLRVTNKALEAGLLRLVDAQRPKASWKAVLAIEEWLVGSETRDAVVERTAGIDSGPAPTQKPRSKTSTKRRSKKQDAVDPALERQTGIDWGALVPRTIGAEVGSLAQVVPAMAAHGEVELKSRDVEREKLEALMDTGKRDKIFPRDIGLEPKIIIAPDEPPTRPSSDGEDWDKVMREAKAKADTATAPAGTATPAAPAADAPASAPAASSGPTKKQRKRTAPVVVDVSEPDDTASPDDASARPENTKRTSASRGARARTPVAGVAVPPAATSSTADADTDEDEATLWAEAKARAEAAEKAEAADAARSAAAADAAKAGAERSAAATIEAERAAAEAARIAEEAAKTEASRVAAEAAAKIEAERVAAEAAKAEAARIAAEAAARAEAERVAAEAAKAEAARIAAEEEAALWAEAKARADAADKAAADKDAADKAAADKAAADKAAADALEADRIAAAEAEAHRIVAERAAAAERAPQERAAAATEAERLADERAARAEAEYVASRKLATERAVEEKAEARRRSEPALAQDSRPVDASTTIDAGHRTAAHASGIPSGSDDGGPAPSAEPRSAADEARAYAARVKAAAQARRRGEDSGSFEKAPEHASLDAESLVKQLVSDAIPPDEQMTTPVPRVDVELTTTPFVRTDAPSEAITAPVEAPPPVPVSGPTEASVTAPVTAPVTTSVTAPVSAPVSAPVEAPVSAPVASPPVEAPPVEAPPVATPTAAASESAPATDVVAPAATSGEHVIQAAHAHSVNGGATPVATADEPSDGIIRSSSGESESARAARLKKVLPPNPPAHDGPEVKEATGEIAESTRTTSPATSEPSVLIADLQAVHVAASAHATDKKPAHPVDAASASRELEVQETRRDAVAFTEDEEAFFKRAESHTHSVPKIESFDDLDEGYEPPPSFWERVFGKKKKKEE